MENVLDFILMALQYAKLDFMEKKGQFAWIM